jgi:hypothetical protein
MLKITAQKVYNKKQTDDINEQKKRLKRVGDKVS